jgi:opacity protein-like surface antigen
MRSVKSLLAAGAASLLSSVAFAADMAIAPPPPMAYAPPPAQDFGGWYLRGDIGMTTTEGGKLHTNLYDTLPANTITNQYGHGFDGGMMYGVGVGYQFNNWFRADVTGEYRSKVAFKGQDFFIFNPGGGLADTYNGGYKSWVAMVNGYVDLGTWWCITPFIGAGVGAANIRTTGFSDVATFPAFDGRTSAYFADGASKTNFAWAVHAGLAYKVTNNFTVELAYRYLDMGTAVHGQGHFFDGTPTGVSTFQYRDITSHDLKLGVRWNLESPQVYAPAPLIRKG